MQALSSVPSAQDAFHQLFKVNTKGPSWSASPSPQPPDSSLFSCSFCSNVFMLFCSCMPSPTLLLPLEFSHLPAISPSPDWSCPGLSFKMQLHSHCECKDFWISLCLIQLLLCPPPLPSHHDNINTIFISIYNQDVPRKVGRINVCIRHIWGSLICTIISSVNSESLTSFPICIPLIYFCYLIALARTWSTTLNRYGESEQPCLVPDFSGICWAKIISGPVPRVLWDRKKPGSSSGPILRGQ